MFFIIFIVLILLAMVVHELSHGMIMRKYGIKVPEAGLGLPISCLPSLAIRVSPTFTFKIHPFLLGAYVMPVEEARIEKLSYLKKAHIYGAGIIANFIMGFLMMIPWVIVKIVKQPETWAASLPILLVLILLTFILWRFSRKMSAYVFPFLGVVMAGYLAWSIISVGAKESLMGPVGLVTMALGFASFYQVMMWGALISVGFAMTNLLPFLPLDGGIIMTGFLEDKFDLKQGTKKAITTASTVFFLAIIVLVFFADASRLIS